MTQSPTQAELTPIVNDLDGVGPDLAEIGHRYWKLAGFDAETGFPLWAETASAIYGGQAYVAAAAAVRAVLPSLTCPSCEQPLSLTSRAALDKIIAGQPVAKCVDCDTALLDKAAGVRKRLAKANARTSRTTEHHRVQHLRQLYRDEQDATLLDHYQVRMLPDTAIPAGSVREEAITLALLSYAPKPAPLGPIDLWVDPLYPRASRSSHCVAEALIAGLLRIHPDSPVNAFVWEPATFEHAYAALTPDGDEENLIQEVELTNQYYASRATHYTPYGHSLDTAAAAVREHLATRLDPATMTEARQAQLRGLIVEVIAEEALRYLEVLLDEHNLPEVPDNHRDKLKQAAYDVAATRSLGELYYLAWCSARDAAAAAQRNPHAPQINMTVHGVNRFESRAQQALDPNRELRRFNPRADLELAALTRTVFLRILHLDPFTTGVDDISWPPPVTSAPPRPGGGDSTDFPHLHCSTCGSLVSSQEAWMWVDVRDAFHYLHESDKVTTSGEYVDHFLNDDPARWIIGHADCGPDGDALYEARLPQTHRAFLIWAAEITRSRWIGGTDISALLTEAATHTGRFDNHAQ